VEAGSLVARCSQYQQALQDKLHSAGWTAVLCYADLSCCWGRPQEDVFKGGTMSGIVLVLSLSWLQLPGSFANSNELSVLCADRLDDSTSLDKALIAVLPSC